MRSFGGTSDTSLGGTVIGAYALLALAFIGIISGPGPVLVIAAVIIVGAAIAHRLGLLDAPDGYRFSAPESLDASQRVAERLQAAQAATTNRPTGLPAPADVLDQPADDADGEVADGSPIPAPAASGQAA